MRTWLVAGLLVPLVASTGCKSGGGAEAGSPSAAAAGSPSAPASTAEQDALWALAPSGATFGAVVSPRGVGLIERSERALEALVMSAPELATLRPMMADALAQTGGKLPALADYGMSADKAFAVFLTEESAPVIVLPLADRAKWLAKLHGTQGADGDKLPGFVCKLVSTRYVCAPDAALFARVGHGDFTAARKTAGARGELEAALVPAAGKAGVTLGLAAQLDAGAFTMYGGVAGVGPEPAKRLGAPGRPRPDAATDSGFGVLDIAPMLADVPAVPIAPKVTAADLAHSIAGPITFGVAAGTTNLDARLPLGDPAPARAVVEHCAELPALAALAPTMTAGTCHLPIAQVGITLDVRVEGKELRISTHGDAAAVRLAQTGLGAVIAGSAWSAGFYGRGSLFAANLPAPLLGLMPKADTETKIVMRALSLITEVGLGIRKDGDALQFVLGARTIWANPADVVQKLLAIGPDQITAGTAAAAAREVAAGAPGSLFATDLRAGVGGGIALIGPIGVAAAVGVPAFMDYSKRSKHSEAELQLNKIGKNAKRVYAETSTFPVGAAAQTPGTTCCKGPNNHCVTTPSDWQKPVWQALDFQIDEPQLFRYAYKSDGKSFVATAVGDLDCDGVEITYELRGTIDAGGNPKVTLTAPPPNAD